MWQVEFGESGPKTAKLEWTGVGTWIPDDVAIEVDGGDRFDCVHHSGGFPAMNSGDEPVELTCEIVIWNTV